MTELIIDSKRFWVGLAVSHRLHTKQGLSFSEAHAAASEYTKTLTDEEIELEYAQNLIEGAYDNISISATAKHS